MKAVILAGGRGTRLRPMTQELPKPLVPVMGEPCLRHILSLLARHGVTEAAVTVQFQAEKIRSWCEATALPLPVHLFEEREPLGTAGGVRAAADFLGDGDFLVISGDCVCDFDLTDAIRRHRERRADATLLLSRAEEPLEYGVVVTGEDGRILRFLEKPGWSQAWTNTVNCGIYLLGPEALSRIPPNLFYDFSKDLFPRMLAEGLRLFGDAPEGYWCDIGDIHSYLRCHRDILDGRCRLELSSAPWVQKPSSVNGALVLPPSYLADGVTPEPGCVVGPYAVVGQNASLGAGSVVRDSVLHGRVRVGDQACVHGAVLCAGTVLRENAAACRGSVAGAGSTLGVSATLAPDARLAPGAGVPDHAVAQGTFRRGGDLFSGTLGEELPLSRCMEIGLAAGRPGQRVALMHGGGAAARAADCLAAGLRAAGSHVVDGGAGFEAQLLWAAAELDCDSGIYAALGEDSSVSIRFCSGEGAPLPRSESRRILTALRDGLFVPVPRSDAPGPTRSLRRLYREALRDAAGNLRGLAVRVDGQHDAAETLRRALAAAGVCDRAGGLTLSPSADGRSLSLRDETGAEMTGTAVRLLLCRERLRTGEPVAVFHRFPRAVDEWEPSPVLRVLTEPADDSDAEARRLLRREHFMKDGLFCAAELLRHLKTTHRRLSELRRRLPDCHLRRRAVPVPKERLSGVMGQLCRECDPRRLREGVLLERPGGKLLITPQQGRELLIQAEAARAETAEELCGDMVRELQALLRQPLS